MGKQKVVVKLTMEDDSKRCKALQIVVGLPGVISAGLEGQDKDQIVVIGDEIDSVTLTKKLRKKMGHVDLVSVNAVEEKKKEEKKEEKKDDAAKSVQPIVWPGHYYVEHPTQYVVRESSDDPCSIM